MSQSDRQFEESTKGGWVMGTTAFAGVLLATLGSFQILQGLAAVLEDEVFVRGVEYSYKLDLTTWGWWLMLLGAAAVAVGIGIALNNVVANIAGLVLAFLSALSNFAFLPYYPFWSILVIAFDALVIWAICVQLARR
ncbi:hypothetical protein EKO23_13725 [Nocardioides guangzhouensis]|uniref:DUF7144 domain-containing protein n=1 Tax=Nocardioides guangzhouensis TaxID=2497878 RepID=A0A4Q4ZAV3_9ACTN|nr:hypothetical protein [Nocardioides guangzhouensis]RYP85043.1 hypothetical protein EKO23_13725 [Nocardioides guangzhouensis]